MIERLTVFPGGDMEVKYRICVFGGIGEEKKLMKRRKRVPARSAVTRSITP